MRGNSPRGVVSARQVQAPWVASEVLRRRWSRSECHVSECGLVSPWLLEQCGATESLLAMHWAAVGLSGAAAPGARCPAPPPAGPSAQERGEKGTAIKK